MLIKIQANKSYIKQIKFLSNLYEDKIKTLFSTINNAANTCFVNIES